MKSVDVIEADLNRQDHQKKIVDLINAYAMDPMGNGAPLSPSVKENLIPGLREHPTTVIFLAVVDGEAIGIAVCFLGFSTFNARRLINIHDLAVLPAYRGSGAGRLLLAGVEEKARELGCCKVTLEVQRKNHRARQVYETAGFSQARYHPDAGGSLFYIKPL